MNIEMILKFSKQLKTTNKYITEKRLFIKLWTLDNSRLNLNYPVEMCLLKVTHCQELIIKIS